MKTQTRIETDSKRIDDELHRQYHRTIMIYERFNVELEMQKIELEEWKKEEKRMAMIKAYMEEITQILRKAAVVRQL